VTSAVDELGYALEFILGARQAYQRILEADVVGDDTIKGRVLTLDADLRRTQARLRTLYNDRREEEK
jgi:hypothetical protein